MMGDNRDNSTDSRVLSQVGYVPFENIVGRAQIIFFSIARRRARLAGLALAVGGPLEPAVHDRAMSRGPQSQIASASAPASDRPSPQASRPTRLPPSQVRRRQTSKKRRRRAPPLLEETHRLSLHGPGAARARADAYFRADRARNRAGSYQRLEFLGDHVLGLVVSDMLFRAFPKADEGELSRRLADLVRKETCADVARAIDLGAAIRLGSSEANAGGRDRTAILADVCEALIGAVFSTAAIAAAAALIERLWGERMRAPARPLRDPKTVLQEWAQARGLPTPAYREVERTGPAPRSGIPRRGRTARPRAGRRARPLQARRRAGGRRRHADARGRQGGTARWLSSRPARQPARAAASSR